MDAAELIGDDEVILRRVPPSTPDVVSTKACPPTGRLRATSIRMSTFPGEEGLSCTRLRQTSPQELLADLRNDLVDPTGWYVCRMFVSEVRSLGLEVIHKPTDRDPGHCEILGKSQSTTLAFPNNKSQSLAKRTRILTASEVVTLKAGDMLVD